MVLFDSTSDWLTNRVQKKNGAIGMYWIEFSQPYFWRITGQDHVSLWRQGIRICTSTPSQIWSVWQHRAKLSWLGSVVVPPVAKLLLLDYFETSSPTLLFCTKMTFTNKKPSEFNAAISISLAFTRRLYVNFTSIAGPLSWAFPHTGHMLLPCISCISCISWSDLA